MTSVAGSWHPIATCDEVTDTPKRFTLLGTDLVAFRTKSGVSAFTDLCVHRGVALSLGFIEDDLLHCGYHGWTYDSDGACVRIPSLPVGSPIPPKARAIAHLVQERYGLVWVAMADPERPIPRFPADEWDDPSFRAFVSHHYTWKTSAGRAVENFMDISHFAYVHEGILGSRDNTLVAEHTVVEQDGELHYFLEAPEPANLHSKPGDVVRWDYNLTGPFVIHLKKTVPNGDVTLISLAASPTTESTCDLFVWIARNHQLDPADDTEFADFTDEIMEQDRVIIESQRPEQIPTDLREELHLKVPDASGIAYRRYLGAIQGVGPFLP